MKSIAIELLVIQFLHRIRGDESICQEREGERNRSEARICRYTMAILGLTTANVLCTYIWFRAERSRILGFVDDKVNPLRSVSSRMRE